MIFLTSMTIGFTAGLMRSVTAVLVAALLILFAYGAASLFSGLVSVRWLVYSILGFNLGIFGLVLCMLALDRRRPAKKRRDA